MAKRSKVLPMIAALLFIVAVGLGFGLLAGRVFNDLSGQSALAWITFVSTTWFAIWNFQKTKRKEAEARIFTQKAPIYKEIIDIIRDLAFAQKGWIPPIGEDALARRFGQVRYDMIVWGGQDTIRAITALEEAAGKPMGEMFATVAHLFAAVRKELGHVDDPEFAEDLFLTQILASDREKVREMLRGGNS